MKPQRKIQGIGKASERKNSAPQRKIQGIGINDTTYPTTIVTTCAKTGVPRKTMCPYYRRWTNMLARCYSAKQSEYDHCTVDPQWHYFSNFRQWMATKDFEGKALDKDLIDANNTVYSPTHCVFISQELNALFTGGNPNRPRSLPVGVTSNKSNTKFRASVSMASGVKFSPWVSSASLAAQAYLLLKIERIIELMPSVEDFRIRASLHQWCLANG